MNYLEKLKTQIRKGSAQGSAMQSKAGVDEVPVVSRTDVQRGKEPVNSYKHDLLRISIADIKPQDVRGFLRLQPDLNFSSCWQLTAEDKIQGPEHLGRQPYLILDILTEARADASIGLILSGYWSAAGRASESKGLMRSRLEATLVAVLASKKRESASAYGSLYLQFEKNLSLPWSYKNRAYVLEGTTDYSLWYGGQKKETNLLFFCASRRGNIGRYQALSSMGV